MTRIIAVLLLLGSSAVAEEVEYIMPRIPSEEAKILALKLGYELNGNSMVGRTIDLTRYLPAVEPSPVPLEKIKPTKGDKRK
jgi:hypothetical protein